jgi:NADH-quinone oxidoreductase subunit M
MILVWLILLPVIGGFFAWYFDGCNDAKARWISVLSLGAGFILTLTVWFMYESGADFYGNGPWIIEFERAWIPYFGIRFHLALDGLSLILVALTFFLGILSVISSWREIRERVGFFHMNLLWTLAGVTGVFLSLDLFLFYFFWELMLVPMYFLIAVWGHENRVYASVKFFIFTQLSGLLMFIAILGLYFMHGHETGIYTFDFRQLLGTSVPPTVAVWLMLGFFVAFAVKLPVLFLHTWLPDAHTEAPTAGSVVLAGLLLKTGAYGMIRFMVPLFPAAVSYFTPAGITLAAAGILYGAFQAFAQRDLKRLVAYTSVSHMGFVLLAVFVWNNLALQGAVIQMVCHGVSTGGLFILVGAVQERLHTRDMGSMGGLWSSVPRMGGAAMVLAMASLGLPGLGNFIGEFLVLIGAYQEHGVITFVATAGLVAATAYSLLMIQKVFHGRGPERGTYEDATVRELSVIAVMIAVLIMLGLYPQPLIKTAGYALKNIERNVPGLQDIVPSVSVMRSHEGGKISDERL